MRLITATAYTTCISRQCADRDKAEVGLPQTHCSRFKNRENVGLGGENDSMAIQINL